MYSENKSLNGFTTQNRSMPTTEFTITRKIDSQNTDQQLVEQNMVEEIVQHIFKNNLIFIEENSSLISNEKILIAKLNICTSGTKYANVIDNFFTINDEIFTNDELIAAVKAYYPERLV